MPITREMLRDYLQEDLTEAEMAAVETALRGDASLLATFKLVQAEIDRGEHTVGAIWRRERLSCPSRDQLGNYLIKAQDEDLEDYIKFHLESIGCPYCQANLEDLQKKQAKADANAKRKKKIVQSTAPALKKVQ